MRLKQQIFLSIFIASTVVSLSVFLILEWDFYRNHFKIVNAINRERLASLAISLKKAYAEHGNWDAVGRDVMLRKKMLEDTLYGKAGVKGQSNFPESNPLLSRPFMYGPNGRQFDRNVILLDADKKNVFGPLVTDKHIDFTIISSQERTVGYLGLLPIKSIIDPRQRNVKHQQISIFSIAFAVFFISVGISVPLANRLLRPVKTLTTALHELASGQYGTRVEIKAGGELGQLASDFNDLALTLEKNKQARCQYTADVSHELRTPLTILKAEIEAVLEGVRQATPAAIASLHVEVTKLDRLINDVYQLSLTDIGALSYRKDTRLISDLLVKAIDGFKNDYAIKRVELHVDLQKPNDFQIHADGDRLHQLFANLMNNSLKYTDSGGKLLIHLECRDDVAIIDFQDSSPGVPSTDLEHIFDRFFRVDKSRNRITGGAGLGLAICKNIVEAHDGSISAHNSPIGGLWIRVELPLIGRNA